MASTLEIPGKIPVIENYEILDGDPGNAKNLRSVKKLKFNMGSALFGLLLFNSCSGKSKDVYHHGDFKGRVFVSNEYVEGLRARLHFLENVSELKADDIPYGVRFSKDYEIIPGDRSPSGKVTISVDSWHYFIIEDIKTLTYRYYDGPHEKTLIFHEKR